MNHTLSLNQGARSLAFSLFKIPDQFKTPPDFLRAAKLSLVLDVGNPPEQKEKELPKDHEKRISEWADTTSPVEVTEPQRDLLKTVITANASKIPISPYAMLLLEQLGFTE